MKYTLAFSLILASFLGISQKGIDVDQSKLGIIKTASNKTLGHGFVAMNENVVFTAAHIITYDEDIFFEDINGKSFPLKVVATDPIGDIGVLMTTEPISNNPYVLNLNYNINIETEIYSLANGAKEMGIQEAILKEKTTQIQKNKEFKSLEVAIDGSKGHIGSPILNNNSEVIGIIIDNTAQKSNKNSKGTSICKVTLLDGDLWKKM